jgi:hypothetical protein
MYQYMEQVLMYVDRTYTCLLYKNWNSLTFNFLVITRLNYI